MSSWDYAQADTSSFVHSTGWLLALQNTGLLSGDRPKIHPELRRWSCRPEENRYNLSLIKWMRYWGHSWTRTGHGWVTWMRSPLARSDNYRLIFLVAEPKGGCCLTCSSTLWHFTKKCHYLYHDNFCFLYFCTIQPEILCSDVFLFDFWCNFGGSRNSGITLPLLSTWFLNSDAKMIL